MNTDVKEVEGVVESDNTLITPGGEPLRSVVMDWDKVCAELGDKPALLKAVIEEYVQQISPLAIILTQEAGSQKWCAFEGQVNLRRGTFRVITPIQTFPCNKLDYRRPPTQALNLVSSCALARGLPIWVP